MPEAAVQSRPDQADLAGQCAALVQAHGHLCGQDLLAAVLDDPAGPAMAELMEAGQAYCKLTVEELQKVAASVQEKVRDLAGILQLELPGGESYADLVVAAHRSLSEVSASAGAMLAHRQRPANSAPGDLRHQLMRAATGPRSRT